MQKVHRYLKTYYYITLCCAYLDIGWPKSFLYLISYILYILYLISYIYYSCYMDGYVDYWKGGINLNPWVCVRNGAEQWPPSWSLRATRWGQNRYYVLMISTTFAIQDIINILRCGGCCGSWTRGTWPAWTSRRGCPGSTRGGTLRWALEVESSPSPCTELQTIHRFLQSRRNVNI